MARVRVMVDALRRLDRGLARIRSVRAVLVEARTPMNLAVLRPVFEPLLKDPRVRVHFTGEDRADLRLAFDELDLLPRVIPRRRAAWMRFDLYANADPWNAVPLRRVHRQLNFFHGVAGKYDLDCPVNLPIGFDRYDRVAFPNEARRDRYVAAGIVAAERAVVVGYPKVDALATRHGSPRAAAMALGLDPRRPTVIFAPTFGPASALNAAGPDIVSTLLGDGWNVIVKLHDRSLDPDPRYSGGIDWRERFRAFDGPTFLMAASGDSTPYALASDVMVTDHSSIGFEFCVLDRPLIVVDAPRLIADARINPEKVQLLRQAADVVTDMPSLAAAARRALTSPQSRSAERRRAAAAVFYRPGEAADRALHLVYELLELSPAPAVVPAGTPRLLSTAK